MCINDKEEEHWATIIEQPNYEVSTHGRVRSIGTCHIHILKGYKRITKDKILKLYANENGYILVRMTGMHRLVHCLVANAFIDKPNSIDKFEVNHKDFDVSNNHYTNLEWLTHAENMKYTRDNERTASKLTKADVIEIKKSIKNNVTTKELANRFNVHYSTISVIKNNKS